MSLLSPQLEAFMAIVRRSTVQQAAQDLGITQTGVTQRIRTLEGRLEATLFTRSRRGMRLTTEGEALLRYCQAALQLEGEVLAKIQNTGTMAEIQVRMTGPSSIMRSRVIPVAVKLLREFPELVYNFDLDDGEKGAHKLKAGESDLAVIPRDEVVPEMDSKLLLPERYILVGPAKWKKIPLKQVIEEKHIVDFDSRDKMTLSYLREHSLREMAHPIRHLANNTDALTAMVMMGVGYSVLDEQFAAPYIRQGHLADLNPGGFYENSLALVWYPRPQMPRYFGEIIKSVK
ncbi:MAG: LysR family transcriptional regulator [Bdellovibrionota bacterium]